MFNRHSKKIQEKLLASFGIIKTDFFDFEQIESYFRKKDNLNSAHLLSDKTCKDLDLQEIFMFVDRTVSKVGQQYLYNNIRTGANEPNRNEIREKLIEKFTVYRDFRVSVQRQLCKLDSDEAYNVSSLFQDELIKSPKWYFVINILSFTNLLCLIFLFINSAVAFVFLGISVVNLVIHYWNKKNLYHYLGSIPQLLKLNGVARRLFSIKDLKIINTDLASSINDLDKVRNRLSFLNLEVRLQADTQAILWLISELFKICFLIEPIMLFGAIRQLDNKKKGIEEVFKFVGEIDTIISIASLRKGLDKYCVPTILNKSKQIIAEEVYHPLIYDCVKNNIRVDGKSILLTGSNMSGKTSFIRTIGINVISGLTLNTCFAECFSMPILRISSAIRISDDLMNDKSYYFEEVLTIKEMIKQSSNDGSNLFLLDEIFKGTNTIERIAAGKAVLSVLNEKENIAFVSTHDIELADLLKEEFDLYHFSEIVSNNTVDFDYKIKPGRLKNRNAIRILQINDYPERIINEAIELSIEFDKNKHFR